MTDQKPDAGDNTLPTDNEATPPEVEEVEPASEQPVEAEAPAADESDEAEAGDSADAEAGDAADEAEAGESTDAEADEAEAGESTDAEAGEPAADADVVAETEAEAADAAASGAAWTTTPVAPDPEATEAALAALAAKPEITLEPPDSPPPPPGDEPPDEGTPVLLVGGILVGAFIVALAIVLILFRPFDNPSDVDASLSPSPAVTEAPSESPSTVATVGTPDFGGMPLEEAEATATDYGLVVRVNPVRTDEEEPGMVLSQDPAPGEVVDEGSTIELSVAQPVATNSVPDVSGLSQANATTALEEAGFVVGDVTRAFSDEVSVGRVISTDPAIDTELSEGSAVDLVISSGPEYVAVPDLVDLTEADALTALTAAGLRAGDATEATDDTIAAGRVISSDPSTDTEVAPDTAVDYVLSTGPALVAVPDLVDLTEADALTALTAAGLRAGDATEATDDTIAAGRVISSDPSTDTEVAPDTAVDYVLSTGPALVAVPDLVDLTEADALTALTAAGLRAGDATEATDDTIAAGRVISSDPSTDTEVAPDTAVDYVLSTGPALVAVPDLAGPAAEAPDTITAAGLAVGDAGQAYSDSVPSGEVLSQDPAPGTEVALGSAVSYVESLGVETVAVPDLAGPAAEAPDTITAAGLAVGDAGQAYSDSVPSGEVLSQDPAPGTEVALGSAVSYVESLGVETVAVPDLAGPAAEAPDTITAAGLAVGDAGQAYSDSVPSGEVLSQDPAPGTEVALGSAVSYVESLGVETVAVPDLAGPAAEAPDTITAAGLAVGDAGQAYSDSVPSGEVLSQDPAPGTEVALGSAVSYVESLGVETVAVPDLAGPAAEAPDTITAAGLAVGDAGQAYSDSVPSGEVLSQDPAPGTEVALGSAVSYVESLGVETVAVPDLAGPAAEAPDTITAAGLAVGDAGQAYSDSVPSGEVLSQDPAPGTEVALGSAVSYVESLGVETVAVPDLAGPAAEAPDTITAAGLAVGDAGQAYSDSVPSGEVLSQDPAPGTEVALGSAVSYVESLGVETVAVPDLAGPAAEAPDTITAAGLAVGDAGQAYSDSVPSGEVLSQDPAPGTEVALGSAVSYVESLGVETVAVPDLAGPAAEAPDTITAAGLAVGDAGQAYSDSVPSGEVLSQDPAPGTEVALGSAVSYVESLGVETVAVPDLAGPAAEAPDTITAAGLAVGDAGQAYSDSVPSGEVLSQDPAPGTEVALGSAVSYVESLGVETVAVPDLAGPAAEAPDTITAAGLAVGDAGQAYSDSVPSGEVLSQDPAPGTEVALGSAVSYVESLGVETVAVPDLAGPAAEAPDTITAAGLAVGDAGQAYSDSVPSGEVLSQDPAPGTEVALGSAVSYVESLGVETVAVPDLAGPAAEAPDTITAAGLAVGDAGQAYSDSVPSGEVLSQDPAPGTEVALGSAVSYVESLGVETVAVPDLAGPAAEAPDTITAAGLAVGDAGQAYSDSVPSGEVLSQDPAPGTEVALGSAVSYVESLGVETVAVPDLAGPAAEAPDTITAAGLAVGDAGQAYSDSVPSGEVLSQDPAPGTEVALGSAVSYVESLGVETVAVPDLAGPAAEAPDTITAAGLAVGDAGQAYSDSVPSGEVLSQDPAPGTEVALGSAVSYVESLGVETVAVPDLAGPAAEAPDTITAAGLAVGDAGQAYSDSVPSGEVLSQDPAPGTEVALGSAVSYVESLGVETVAVPDLAGPAAEAPDTITAAGLAVGDAGQAYSDSVPSGEVLSQDPAPGTEVALGSAVSYVESLGVETVAVPDLAGPAAEAPDTITAAGLAVGDAGQAYSDSVPSGEVLSQDPAPGTEVALGSAVSYVESLGVETVAVPDLAGPAAEAPDTITAAGLAVGDAGQAYSDSVPSGEVLSQDPAPGTEVALGSAVSYVESLGVETVAVPDLAGPAAEAPDTITAAGLAVGDAGQAYSDSVPSGEVLSQDPAPGTEVALGSAVSYVESLGVETVAVPDVREQSQADATTTIEAAGLSVGEILERTNANVPADAAVKTEPAAGEMVDVGSAVTLTMSKGPKRVDVPDVTGLAEADAMAEIEAAELTPGSKSQANSDSVPAGNVIGTNPAAGTTVDAKSTVDYVLSLGVEQVTVPDLVDLTEADATAALGSAGLTSGSVATAFDETIVAGNVVSQDPAAGSDVDKGSMVDYVVSDGPTPFVQVPAVRNLSEADAVAAIEGAALVVGDTLTQAHEKVAAGDAIKTDPAQGEDVLQGSSLVLYVSSGSKFRTIPDVSGQTAAEAQAALEAEDLTVTADERTNAKVKQGDAVKTEPAAGTEVEVGDAVTLVVSKGPKQVVIPDVVGLPRAAAKSTITDSELKVGDETVAEDTAPVNTVIAQDPAPGGEADKNSTVDITVSSGPPQVVIPQVKNTPVADAQAALEGEGLVVSTQERNNASVDAGNAVKTEPAAGKPVEIGSDVLLIVSKGPKPAVVPDVAGLKKGAATTAITEAGLVVGAEAAVEDAAAANTVIAQDPPAGSETPVGSAVDLTISSGPPSVEIPAVKNTPVAEAQATLEGLGLVVGTQERSNASVAAGNAVKTEPAAGEVVPVGSDVLLTVSKGPKMATVPDVSGTAQGAAETAITDAKLAVGTIEVVDGDAPAGTVLSQDPAAGTEVPQGNAVNLTVSAGPPQVEIPAVKNAPADEAQATLEGLGLVVESQERSNASVAAGSAVKTKPAAGALVDVGSTVTLTVSKGPKQVAVPNIVDLKKGAANGVIKDAGLKVGETTTVEDAAPANTVIGQDPPAESTVDQGSLVNYTISSGPPLVQVPEVKNESEARAVNALEGVGLVVQTEQRTNGGVAAGDAVKTDPAAGAMVEVGSTITLTVSKGPKQVTVPNIVGLAEADAQAALTNAELTPGARSDAEDAAPAGTVVAQSPAEGSGLDKNSAVDYTVSTGPAVEPMGAGGDLASPEVSSQLDVVATEIEPVRELTLSNTPYDGSGDRQQQQALAERIGILHDVNAIKPEEKALKRLGLLGGGDDLAALLQTLYGQALPVAYLEGNGHISVVESIGTLDASGRAASAREFGRALVDQQFGLGSTRVEDKTRGDQALAGYALEQGDGTAAMLEWSAAHSNAGQTNDVIVPGDDGIYASMPLVLQREYSFPFLEGRIFADRLRKGGGWNSVNDAWGRPPESTEQILHPNLYPNERPTTVAMDGIAGRLGNGWKENWQQTMGELRTGVWLANGQSGEQSGPKAAVKLPRANAAAGWGGDRLVSLDGPDGQWAIVWQTKWDSAQDVDQFVNAANAVVADLEGAGAVLAADVSGGVSDPALVLIADNADTLAAVGESLGLSVAPPA